MKYYHLFVSHLDLVYRYFAESQRSQELPKDLASRLQLAMATKPLKYVKLMTRESTNAELVMDDIYFQCIAHTTT